MTIPVIAAHHLAKTYPGAVQALDDVDLTVPQGDFAFLVGPNGAGKSTLFKLMTREELPTSGCILFQGRDVGKLRSRDLARHRRLMGVAFQDARLVASKTVYENVALPLEANRVTRDLLSDRVEAVLFLTRLEDLRHRYPSELSGGQKQQVAIARALANRPSVILADEPTGNLSPAATDRIMHLFSVINSCGITVVIATHNREVVDRMGRRVLVLDRGRLVSDTEQGSYPERLGSLAA